MDQPVPSTILLTLKASTPGGYPLGGQYHRNFWLPTVGPSTVCVHELLAGWAAAHPDPQTVDVDELAARVGLPGGTGWHRPILHTLRRLAGFRLADVDLDVDPATVAVRIDVPGLTRRQVAHLPASVRALHDATTKRVPA